MIRAQLALLVVAVAPLVGVRCFPANQHAQIINDVTFHDVRFVMLNASFLFSLVSILVGLVASREIRNRKWAIRLWVFAVAIILGLLSR